MGIQAERVRDTAAGSSPHLPVRHGVHDRADHPKEPISHLDDAADTYPATELHRKTAAVALDESRDQAFVNGDASQVVPLGEVLDGAFSKDLGGGYSESEIVIEASDTAEGAHGRDEGHGRARNRERHADVIVPDSTPAKTSCRVEQGGEAIKPDGTLYMTNSKQRRWERHEGKRLM